MSIDLEEDLSVVIGKNNCGKTSLLLILDKFIGSGYAKNSFSFDDFNIHFKEELKSRVENGAAQDEECSQMGISLNLFIEYDEQDDLSNIGNKVIMDLDPENRVVVLAFEYVITKERLESLGGDYSEYCQKREAGDKEIKDIFSFLQDQHSHYFKLSRKSFQYDISSGTVNEDIFTDLLKEKIQIEKIINFKWISARRSVSNKDSEKALSAQSSRIYKKLEANNGNSEVIEEFKDALSNTDKQLDGIYSELFQEVIDDVKQFGGVKPEDSIIKIVSSLQHKELLEENTTVMYGLGATDHTLPENYNGLGYMNLISMIFEIKILLHEFQKDKDELPADINLLLIEEPEVHTHPQMQRIFIKNIKSLLHTGIDREDGETRKLQTILTTHSSHIVSESDFEDIKYFKRYKGGIVSKNLKNLKEEYGDDTAYYKFLKQYLTLHRSELFFADKAIFIEGDTERILLPAIMKKIDQDDIKSELVQVLDSSLPLLSQNISVIEVGAYSQVFEKFIDFIGIKSLIITDIDSVKLVTDIDDEGNVRQNADGTDKTKEVKCPVSEGEKTSNASLKFYYGDTKDLTNFINLSLEDRILSKSNDTGCWKNNQNGHLLCVYQTKEADCDSAEYHARSFEDAFFHVNRKFISDHAYDADGSFIGNVKFPCLRQADMKKFASSEIDAWEMADAVLKKPPFAMGILLNSRSEKITVKLENADEILMTLEFSNWTIPAYIREGLQWLKQE